MKGSKMKNPGLFLLNNEYSCNGCYAEMAWTLNYRKKQTQRVSALAFAELLYFV